LSVAMIMRGDRRCVIFSDIFVRRLFGDMSASSRDPSRLLSVSVITQETNCDLSTYVGIYKDQIPPVAPRTFDAAWTDDSRHQPYPALAVPNTTLQSSRIYSSDAFSATCRHHPETHLGYSRYQSSLYKDQIPPVAPRTFDAAWTDDSRHQPYPALAVLTNSKLRTQPCNLLGYIRPTPFRRHVGIIPRPISATLGNLQLVPRRRYLLCDD
jgi:hypothetical protein